MRNGVCHARTLARPAVLLLAGGLLIQGATAIGAQDIQPPPAPKATAAAKDASPWPARAAATAAYIDQQWAAPDGWKTIEPWQRFVAVDALIEYGRRTGDQHWLPQIASAVRNRTGLSGNDDDLWAVLASLHDWQLDSDPALLAYASSNYQRLVTDYWDDHCGGGLWWDHARTYKNAITNELLIYASTQLYLATGQEGYRDWALRSWAWFQHSSMIDAQGLVNDGLDAACHNNGAPRFTYNQGVLLGGLSDLTTITGDPQYRAQAVRTALAAIRTLSAPEGILHEPVAMVGSDGMLFKGVFAWHLGRLIDALPQGDERAALTRWAEANAHAVWTLSAQGTGPIDSDWTGQTHQYGPAAQFAGLDMMVAAIR